MVGVLSNFNPPAEGVLLEVPSTKLMVDNEEVGTGTLYIRETDVIWGGGHKRTGGWAPNITILYPNISIHAVQKDPALALYMVVNYDMKDILKLENAGGDQNMDENDDDEYDDDTPITQLRFIPEKESELQAMYAAMCEGQALNPDPADEVDEDQFFMGEADDDEQFADAEVSHPDDGSRLAQQAQHLSLENNENGYDDDQNED